MLVLSRKIDDSIIINENIIVKVLDVTGERVRLGITAPKDVLIMRSELQQTIDANKDAVSSVIPVNLPTDFSNFLKTVLKENADADE